MKSSPFFLSLSRADNEGIQNYMFLTITTYTIEHHVTREFSNSSETLIRL